MAKSVQHIVVRTLTWNFRKSRAQPNFLSLKSVTAQWLDSNIIPMDSKKFEFRYIIYMYDPDSSDSTKLVKNDLDGYRDFRKNHVYTWPLIKWK